MNGINRVFLMGYLGADPERQVSRNGKAFVKLSLATHYNKRMDSGEKEATTVWHRVMVWGKTADVCHSSLQKGSALAVEGYLSRYSYERDDGSEATATSIVAREVHFIGRRRSQLAESTDFSRVGPNGAPDEAPENAPEDATDDESVFGPNHSGTEDSRGRSLNS